MRGDDKRTNYSLWCELCQLGFNGREEWYVHLVGDEHQCHARLGMMGWGRKERKAVLVMFCSEPMDKEGGKLVRWIAGRNWRVMVTDFVWWRERPRVAFVRFESRKALEVVLERCQGQGQVEGITVHFQKASELVELQWDAFLPEEGHQKNLEDSDPQLSLQETPTLFNDLSFQFEAISKPVRVPLVEWTFMQKLLKHLERVGKTFDPPFQTQAFRHSYLKLRLPGYSTNWLIHVFSNGRSFPVEHVEDLLKEVSTYRKSERVIDDHNSSFKMGAEFHRQLNSYDFKFTVVTYAMTVVEAQLSRLTEYMLSFDPRCIPLLGLIYFWCSTNELRICLDETSIKRKYTHLRVPGVAALEWMLISFLGGVAKVIPTAHQVLERPHTPIYMLQDNQLDVGFDCDSNYCEEWRASMENVPKEGTNDFYLSVEELARQFFQYFGTRLKNDRWILNTKDGEMLRTKRIVRISGRTGRRGFKGPKKVPRGTKLSAHEISLLRKAKSKLNPRVNFRKTSLYITHPLYLLWQLGLQNEEVGKMQVLMEATEIRLKNWIDCQRGKKGHLKGKQMDLATVLKVEGLVNGQ